MEVRPTFECEQKRSAARVQNVDHCLASENIELSQFVARQRFGRTSIFQRAVSRNTAMRLLYQSRSKRKNNGSGKRTDSIGHR